MPSAKDIRIAPIASKDARRIVKALHYSGKVVTNSKIHFGVFLGGKCCGAMQFGPSTFQRNMVGLVAGSTVNSFFELNRLAFNETLPRNSESRAIGVACRLLRNHYPLLKWIISFADATQCGDGTIYRASGFVLTQIKRNTQLRFDPRDGTTKHAISAHHEGRSAQFLRWEKAPGYQLRYIRFLDPAWRSRLTVPEIPFGRIREVGADMYRGKRR